MGTPSRRGVHPFIAFLHDLRVSRNLSHQDIFRRGGPKQPCLSQLENGMQQPTCFNLEKYAAALGLRLAMVDGKGNVYEYPDVG